VKLEDLRKAARGEEEDDEDALASLPKPPPAASVEEAEWIKSVLPSPQLPEWEKLPLVDSAPTPQELFKLMAELGQPVTAMNIDAGFVECVRKALIIMWRNRLHTQWPSRVGHEWIRDEPPYRKLVGIDMAAPGSERTGIAIRTHGGGGGSVKPIDVRIDIGARTRREEAEALKKALYNGEFLLPEGYTGEKGER
jgi:hypothetical protein